jgi:uncharacterized damage-inducible protein DinB
MELKEYILVELSGLERGVKRVTDSLTQQELMWRPSSGCNSIGLILFHIARLEDSFIKTRIQSKPTIWMTEKWYEKLKLAENEEGAHYTLEQVNAFPVPDREGLLAFYSAVQAQTKEYLNSLTPDALDRKVTMPRGGDVAILSLFSFIISHASGHIGEMSYLRGLQRGMDK